MLSHVVKYSSWQLAAQMLSASTMLVLTALLPASPLATYGYALTVSSLASSFATMRMEQAILVAETDSESSNLAWGAMLVAFIVSIILVVLDAFRVFGSADGSYSAGAISAFSMCAVNISQQALIRKGRSDYAGRIATLRALAVSGGVIAVAYFGNRTNATSVLWGLSCASLLVAIWCVLELFQMEEERSTLFSIYATSKRYADIWISYWGQSIFSGVSLNAPYFAIFHFTEPRYAAAYLLADRVVRTPVTLLSNSVRSHLTHQYRVLFEQCKTAVAGGILRKWSGALGLIGLFILPMGGMTLWLLGRYIAEDKWQQAGMAVLAMSLWGASVMSNPPATAMLTACRKNSIMLKMQVLELVARLVCIFGAVEFIFARTFYIGLFIILAPGIIYNVSLWKAAHKAWAKLSEKVALSGLSGDSVEVIR